MRRLLPALVLSLLLAGVGRAQTTAPVPYPRITHLTMADGLSENYVFHILQDRQGFMWFASRDGLNRYDGYTFAAFRHAPFDATSIPPGDIFCLYEDHAGMLWVCTRQGLGRMDPHTGRTTHFRHDPGNPATLSSDRVRDVGEDADGRIWVGTEEGLDRLDPATGRVTRFIADFEDATRLQSPRVYNAYPGSDGGVWVSTYNGVARIDPRTGTLRRILYDPAPFRSGTLTLLKGRGLVSYSLHESPGHRGLLWVGTDSGLVRLDMKTGAHARFVPDVAPGVADPKGTTMIFRIVTDPSNADVLWLNTPSGGLLRFDTRTAAFTRFTADRANPAALQSNQMGALRADRQGRIWVGALGGGVSRFAPAEVPVATYRKDASDPNPLFSQEGADLFVARSGDLWIGSGAGITHVDRASGTYTLFAHDAYGYLRSASLYEDATGMVWIGSWRGLYRFDRARRALTFVTAIDPIVQRNDVRISNSAGVYRLFEAAGTFWAATLTGIVALDRTGHAVASYPVPATPDAAPVRFTTAALLDRRGHFRTAFLDGHVYAFDPATRRYTYTGRAGKGAVDLYRLDGGPTALFEDARGTLWVTIRNEGLRRYDPSGRRFVAAENDPRDPATLSSNTINDVFERAREPGILWLAMAGTGLDRLDTRTGRVTHFTTREGLPNNTVHRILEDARGRLWLSTNRGLSRFTPETGQFRTFGPEQGLQGYQFSDGSAFRAPTGELFFGGLDGVNAFFPDQLGEDAVPPRVLLTGLRLSNRTVAPGADPVLPKPLAETRVLRLPHDRNVFTLEYVGLHFKAPAGNRYAYRLRGFDPGWVDAGTRREATYTNLSPGRYTFEVKAANADGVWSAPVSLPVVVLPPWWRTWWAYALYTLLIAGLLWLLVRAVRHRAQARERERAKDRELAQAKQIEAAYHETERAYTQLKGAQAQLVQQEKLASLGALTAGIAHEIKNPLNFVNNFAQLSEELVHEIKSERAEKPDLRVSDVEDLLDDLSSNAARIREHGQRADSIVKNMLAHSRGGAGTRESVDVNALLDEYTTLAFHGMRAQRPDFTCTVERALEAPAGTRVLAVPQELSRVVLNLVGNALYAVAKRREREGASYEPTVRVSTQVVGASVELVVWDNGGGIPEAVRGKIFEPFFTTKPTGEGTGLGLSLSHDIVAAHGGTLGVQSAGGETTFTLALPAAGILEETTP